ncbi:Uncharacterised protein [Nocardia farcinica]|uniref:hypothetical protein n=1 Tax=Nocardia farcinica TaxID=37329 RepID=UPI000A3A0D0A|nr:hypothetical protein [Nocardia farcinica]SUE28947.1 Uncharacterised protein [Nocardia farcinica]
MPTPTAKSFEVSVADEDGTTFHYHEYDNASFEILGNSVLRVVSGRDKGVIHFAPGYRLKVTENVLAKAEQKPAKKAVTLG